jgi:hypothetical protein
VAGTTYSLSDAAPFVWQGESGTGLPAVARQTERGPAQHGDTDVGMRLEPRTFHEKLLIAPATRALHFDQRQAFAAIVCPDDDPIVLRWTLDNGDVRCIDCHYTGGADFDTSDRKGHAQPFVATFRAADPLFYDPTMQVLAFGIVVTAAVFEFPASFPVSFGEPSDINTTRSIAYPGTFLTFPEIIIDGPIEDCVITNLTTGDKLDFTGTTISAGERWTIDLRYGAKTVEDDSVPPVNKINTLTDDSDLESFCIQSRRRVPGGVNDINVTGASCTNATQIYIRYYNRYLNM